MKKIVSVVATLAFVGALTWAAERGRDNSDPEIAIERLTKRMAALETKLAEVQQQLKTLNERPPVFAVPTQPGTGNLPPFGAPDEKGEVWREGTINGWKFYVIPLNGETPKGR